MPFDLELEQAVAKMQKGDAPMSKADQHAQLRKFARRQRLPNESEQQAFVKLITTDPHGQQLYRTYTQTKAVNFNMLPSGPQPGGHPSPKPQTGRDGSEVDDSPGMKTLREIADKIRAKHPELAMSKSTAISIALQTPAGAAAYLQDRKARLGA